jgi:hypothetical protein
MESISAVHVIPSELDGYFEDPTIQSAIISDDIHAINPQTTLDGCTNVQFHIPSYPDKCIDMRNIFLRLLIQIVKKGGEKFNEANNAMAENPFVVNNLMHSIFKSTTVEMNGQVVSNLPLYHYKAYIENLVNVDKNCVDKAASEGWYMDAPDKFDDISEANAGAKSRKGKTYNSKTYELYGKPHIDVFNTKNFLISGVDMNVNFELEDSSFYCLKPAANEIIPTVKIMEATMYVRYVKISPGYLLAQHKMLSAKNGNFRFKRNMMKHFIIPQGVISQNFESIFSGALPSTVVVGFVDNAAFNGDYIKNPFNFQHFRLTQLQFNVNGENVPNAPLTMDANAGLVNRAYRELYNNLNCEDKNFGLQFSEDGFRKGSAIYVTNLSPTKGYQVTNPNENGILKLGVKFQVALTQPIVMVVYGEFNSSFEITSAKSVRVNY